MKTTSEMSTEEAADFYRRRQNAHEIQQTLGGLKKKKGNYAGGKFLNKKRIAVVELSSTA